MKNEKLSTGSYEVRFDAHSFSSGVYFYRIETADFVGVKKMVVVK